MYAVYLRLKDSDILVLPVEIHVEMTGIAHFVFHLLLHAGIFRNNDPDIKVVFVDAFRKGANYICQPSGLNKRNTL